MKLTKSKLRQIIKEELTNLTEMYKEQTPARPINTVQPQQGGEQKADVSLMLKNISRINTIDEYYQLLSAVLGQAKNVPKGRHALKMVYRSLPSTIKNIEK